jgi:kynurenine 3-monooxygenase
VRKEEANNETWRQKSFLSCFVIHFFIQTAERRMMVAASSATHHTFQRVLLLLSWLFLTVSGAFFVPTNNRKDPVVVPHQQRRQCPTIRRISPILSATRSTVGTSTIPPSSSSIVDNSRPQVSKQDFPVVVCGGGPAGLLSAIMLAQRYTRNDPSSVIHVFDTLEEPPRVDDESLWSDFARFYTLGVFGRGKKALEHFGVWDDIIQPIAQELVGSQAWRGNMTATPPPPIALYKDSGREPIYALPRDKLVSALYQHIREEYPNQIQFHFSQQVTPLQFDYDNGAKVLLEISSTCTNSTSASNGSNNNNGTGSCYQATTGFLLGADGAARTVANRMEEVEREEWNHMAKSNPWKRLVAGRPFRVTRYVDDNPRVYKTIPVQIPDDWRPDIGYSASDPERRYNIVSLPANTKGGLCAVLLMKEGDALAQADTDPKELREVLDTRLPVFSQLVDDDTVAAVAKKPPSTFPFFRYAGPRLHKGERTVILGDACHSVKPYNGLGVNSAFEDVRILSDILQQGNSLKDSVQAFSKTRAKDCKTVVKLSRAQDRPNRLGFYSSFLIPLLMDAFFHKALPSVFTPPIPGLIHNDKYRFHQVAVRKRWERLAQVSILSIGAALTARASQLTVAFLSKALQIKQYAVTGVVLAPIAVYLTARRIRNQSRKRG